MSRSEVLRRLKRLHAMLEHVAPESAATVREAIALLEAGWVFDGVAGQNRALSGHSCPLD
jgi:hypothetical protein